MGMENTERQENREIPENTPDVQYPEITEKKEKKRKRERRPKNRRALGAALRVVQHSALAVMVFAMIVVTVGTTMQIQSVNHSWGGTIEYVSYTPDPGTPFEDSRVFNQIFGHAAADIIRFGVVSSQLETDGVFDSGKIVDVTAYNYRSSGLPEKYVTANYRLEDLLKWQKYGFEWTTERMTETEAADFLARKTQITAIDPDSGYRNTSDAGYLKSDVDSYTTIQDVTTGTALKAGASYTVDDSGFVEGYEPAGALGDHAEVMVEYEEGYVAEEAGAEEETAISSESANDGTDTVEYNVLINRYKTVDGKKLEDYVSDWELYYDLCHSVQNAAESLYYNYEEYLTYADYYSMENSNVRYLIEKKVGDQTQYYSNMPEGSNDREMALRKMQDYGTQEKMGEPLHEKFIYYSPADMKYVTNTSIAESTISQILRGYDYAYPESVRIWLSVDTSYPAADAFQQGRDYLPNLWMWMAAAIVCGFLYLILFVYQTVTTGREYDEEGVKRIRLNAFDQIPTEAALLISFVVALFAIWIVVVMTELAGCDPTDVEYFREAIHQDWFAVALFGIVFAADVVFTFFFYSLVRRIKARELFKNSYLYRLLLRLKQFAWQVYDNGGIVLRTWVPYGAFLLFHLFVLNASRYGDFDLLLILLICIVDVLVGVLLYKDAKERQGIVQGIETIAGGQVEHQIDAEELHGDNKVLANSVNSIGKGIKEAVEISMKDERMKADLITNVSHDIKTPLTSIINYVDLLKRERVDNEKVQNYIRVLDEKSQRLKQLTDDLVEASKITSGNISYHFERINLTELLNQTIGEFSEKFETKRLTTVMNVNTRNVVIEADSRRIWRVMENLFNNVFKYAMSGTRVYVTLDQRESEKQDGIEQIEISIKNISENPLNCRPEELTERFIRGDESRTTEGSGLGLSIAKNLTVAQRGSFEIELDGDLFKVFLTFPAVGESV